MKNFKLFLKNHKEHIFIIFFGLIFIVLINIDYKPIKKIFFGIEVENISDGMKMSKCKKCKAIIVYDIIKSQNDIHDAKKEIKNNLIYSKITDNAQSVVEIEEIEDCKKLSKYKYAKIKVDDIKYKEFDMKYQMCCVANNFRSSDWKKFIKWYYNNKNKKFYVMSNMIIYESAIPLTTVDNPSYILNKILHFKINYMPFELIQFNYSISYYFFSEEDISKRKIMYKMKLLKKLGYKLEECSPIYYFAGCRAKEGFDYIKR